MNWEVLKQKVTEEVLKELGKSGPEGSPPAVGVLSRAASEGIPDSADILAVLTGGDGALDVALEQVRRLAASGYRLAAVVSRGAEQVVGEGFIRDAIGDLPLLTGDDLRAGLTLADSASAVIVPVLSLASAAKIASLQADTLATNVIIHALLKGKKVIAARDSILCCGTTAQTLPFPLRRKIEDHLNSLKSYGVILTDASRLAEETTKVVGGPRGGHGLPRKETSVGPLPRTENLTGRGPCAQTEGGDCSGCGQCANRNSEVVRRIVAEGAQRLSKAPGEQVIDLELARMIDHTLLKPDASVDQVTKLCEEAKKYNFASVCVNPANVALAARVLKGTPVKVCTVIGFPLGATTPTIKAVETRDAIANGAQEVDMVINVGALKSGDYDLVKRDIEAVVDAARGKALTKVILETSLLTKEEKVKACLLAKYAGADFVKTATGFGPGGATVEDIALMRQTVGPEMGVKASGGIRDFETAQEMVRAGATRIGASASVAIVKGEASKSSSVKSAKAY